MSLEIVVGAGGGRVLAGPGFNIFVDGQGFAWSVVVGERVFSFFVVVDGRGVEKGSVEDEVSVDPT